MLYNEYTSTDLRYIAFSQTLGKTTLAALLANECGHLEGWTNCACVVRFIGVSIGSSTLEQMLRNICEQICLVYGAPIPLATQV